VNANFGPVAFQLQEIENAARNVAQGIVIAMSGTDEELDAAFAQFVKEHVGALLVAGSPFFDTRRHRVVELAKQQRLPAIYQFREYVSAGGLLSYGVDLAASYQQFGVYAANILKGAEPATLPVQQAVKFEMVLNLKTARELNLEIPPTILALADEVID
jgi:putative tryptophan/tyrosine transport system substrate-binding protein